MSDLQTIFLPASIGSFCVIASTAQGFMRMGVPRYSGKKFEHPYAPWKEEHADPKGYRAFKASQNQVEWTVLTVPVLFMHSLYSSKVPYVGQYLPWAGAAAAVLYSYFNDQYILGYTESADKRIPPFTRRTQMFKFLFYTTMLGLASTLLQQHAPDTLLEAVRMS